MNRQEAITSAFSPDVHVSEGSADPAPASPVRIHPFFRERPQDPTEEADGLNPLVAFPACETPEDADAQRIRLTTSCHDADRLPRVDGAGDVVELEGRRVQIMHNGVKVLADGYCGAWMTEIIRRLKGCHEPQEEVVFDAIIERLSSEGASNPVMVEFGAWWAYYALWFLHRLPQGSAVAVEPDARYLETGRENARLNGVEDRMRFVHAAVGASPGVPFAFGSQSDGQEHDIDQHDLESLMAATGLQHVDVVLADIQGYESVLLERALPLLARNAVRFLVVSTHQHSVSGDPLTHQKTLRALVDAGAHVIAEHSVPESFSGDGLIAVSFDPADAGFTVEISRARAADSIYGDVEFDLAAEAAQRQLVRRRLSEENAALRSERDAALTEIAAIRATRLWRWSAPARAAYGRVRNGFAGRR